jgi:VanZ family protein
MHGVFFQSNPQRQASRQGVDWRWWLKVWVPVLVAIAVIAAESTNTFSAQNTSGWLRPLFERWFGHFHDADWELFHHYMRKTGHFVGYGTVGFTFLRAWLYTLAQRGSNGLLVWRLESCLLAILSTALVAACDEFHQTFIPSRTGTPVDVLLDTCGATALCVLVWLLCWSRPRRVEESPVGG